MCGDRDPGTAIARAQVPCRLMIAIQIALAPFRPRRALALLDAHGSTASAVATVLITGVAAAVLQLLSGAIEPSGRAAQPVQAAAISIGLPALLVGYWLGSALLIDVAAHLMGADRELARVRRLTAYAYPVLIGYAAVTLAQSVADRVTGNGDVALGLGILNLAVLLWFTAVTAVAVARGSRLPALQSAVAALFPFAVMSTLLVVLTIVAAVIHLMGGGS